MSNIVLDCKALTIRYARA